MRMELHAKRNPSGDRVNDISVYLDGDEINTAIMGYLTKHEVRITGPKTITVNGQRCTESCVHLGPSGSIDVAALSKCATDIDFERIPSLSTIATYRSSSDVPNFQNVMPDPGKGYRWLVKGETRRSDDEIYHSGRWCSTPWPGTPCPVNFKTRRLIR